MKAISAIVSLLIKAVNDGTNININSIKTQICATYGLGEQPKTVDIIAAIPEHYKEDLLPFLKTKPIRTASGV